MNCACSSSDGHISATLLSYCRITRPPQKASFLRHDTVPPSYTVWNITQLQNRHISVGLRVRVRDLTRCYYGSDLVLWLFAGELWHFHFSLINTHDEGINFIVTLQSSTSLINLYSMFFNVAFFFESCMKKHQSCALLPQDLSKTLLLYTVPAVQGFFRSISLSRGNNLQDTLRWLKWL